MVIVEFFAEFWAPFVGVIAIALAVFMTANVVLHKRNERAAVGWVGLIWLSPYLGAILYVLLGINRIRRRASKLRPSRALTFAGGGTHLVRQEDLGARLPAARGHLAHLAKLVEAVTRAPLTEGNSLTPLINGDEGYPEMLEAIASAERSVALSSYIIKNDAAGQLFIAALADAVRRGLEVRVLIDGLGALYSIPTVLGPLRRSGVTAERFLHSFFPWRMPYLNLRNHQKLLILDGKLAFTGGLNIGAGNLLARRSGHAIQDIHFKVTGPVVEQMMEVFADDWSFSTGESLYSDNWFPPLAPAGKVIARGIASGPDQDFEKIRWTLLGALKEAQESVRIVTPYFLPDESLATALRLAAMRGVTVDILLPAKSNLSFVAWASAPLLGVLIEAGCRFWMSPPPFDHSKLMVIDGAWTLVGSTNWDPRSLSLNFEFNLECYDAGLAEELGAVIAAKQSRAAPLALSDLENRSLLLQLRDGVARLFTPYL